MSLIERLDPKNHFFLEQIGDETLRTAIEDLFKAYRPRLREVLGFNDNGRDIVDDVKYTDLLNILTTEVFVEAARNQRLALLTVPTAAIAAKVFLTQQLAPLARYVTIA